MGSGPGPGTPAQDLASPRLVVLVRVRGRARCRRLEAPSLPRDNLPWSAAPTGPKHHHHLPVTPLSTRPRYLSAATLQEQEFCRHRHQERQRKPRG